MKRWIGLCLVVGGCGGAGGAQTPTTAPSPVATAVVASTRYDPMPVCPQRQGALDAAAQRLQAGELERAYGGLVAAREACPVDHALLEKVIEVAIEQGRFEYADVLLTTDQDPRLDPLRARLALARRDVVSARALVSQAETADPVTARRLYDRALIAFEREQEVGPGLVYLAHADRQPRPAPIGKYSLWPSLDLQGNRGWVVADERGHPHRWYQGHTARFLTEDLLAVDSTLVHLESGVAHTEWSPFRPLLSEDGRLVLAHGASLRILRTADLGAVARIDGTAIGNAEHGRWLGSDRVALWSEQGALIYDVKTNTNVLEVSGKVALSSSGRYLASLGAFPGTGRLVVHDLETVREAFGADVPVHGWSRGLAFSADERRLVYLPNDGTVQAFTVPGGVRQRLGRPSSDPEYYPEKEIRETYVTNDGYVCANRSSHRYGTCEHDVLFSLTGRALHKQGAYQLKCLAGPKGMRVVRFPRGPLSAKHRQVLPSLELPAVGACNVALDDDGARAAWLEGKEVDGFLEDPVLVVFDPRSGRVIHQAQLPTGKRHVLWSLSYRLRFSGEKLTLDFDDRVVHLDAKSGKTVTLKREPPFPRAATLLGAGDGQAWTARMAWDLRHLHARHITTEPQPDDRHSILPNGAVMVADGGRELARITLYDADHALVRYPDGTLEPRGFAPDELGCAFGDVVAPWEVCMHRLSPVQPYEARWAAWSDGHR